MSAVTDSSLDSEPTQFFHYAQSPHLMMRKMGYNLHHGEGLNFKKDDAVFYGISCQKGSRQITMIKHRVGIYYTSYSTSIRRQWIYPVTFCHFVWVGIRCQCGDAFQEPLRQYDFDRSIGAWRGYWNVWCWTMGSATCSLVGKTIRTTRTTL